jgi:hypothetical protein
VLDVPHEYACALESARALSSRALRPLASRPVVKVGPRGCWLLLAILLLSFPSVSCRPDGGAPANPTAPDLTPFILSGFVTENDEGLSPIGAALVEVTSGPHSGTSATTDSMGRYAISGLSGELNVRASRAGFVPTGRTVNMTQNLTANFSLSREDPPEPPPPPEPTFILSGSVTGGEATAEPIAGARVEVTSGPRAGDSATTDTSGHYAIPGLAKGIVVRASREGFIARDHDVEITMDTTLDFSLLRTPKIGMCLDLVAEEVHITNNDPDDLVLTDWILRDDGDMNEFTFVVDRPCRESMEGFTLAAGMTVIITSGDDPRHEPPDRIIGWCAQVWDDAGDTARLFHPDGELVVEAVGSLVGC